MRICNDPGCTTWTEKPKCPAHTSARRRSSDARRGTSSERGYGARWRRIADRYRRAHPICEDPSGCTEPSFDVDHIDGGGPFGDNRDENLMALCKSHHSRKTARQDGGFGRGRS